MKVGKARIANLADVNRRVYADKKTSSRVLFANDAWDVASGEKMSSMAFFSSGVLELPTGGEIASHKHLHREEIYFVLQGSGEITADGKTVTVKEGHAIWFPAETEHRAYNPNEETLLFYFATAVIEPGHMSHD